jgi:hypothetical protein
MERMRHNQQATAQLRLAELPAVLSLVTDLGMGQPAEEAARACLLATGLARKMNLAKGEVAGIYYTTLLKYLGCTAYAHEEALFFGGTTSSYVPVALKSIFQIRERPCLLSSSNRAATAHCPGESSSSPKDWLKGRGLIAI